VIEVLVVLALVAAGQSSCPPPFQAAGGTCLYMGADSMSWSDARDYCATLSAESEISQLATFPTCDEFSLATYWLNVNSVPGSDLWVGAVKASYPNNWIWITLEHLQTGVPMWAYSEGHDDGMDCGSMSKNFKHKIACSFCEELKQPLCEIKQTATLPVKAVLPEPKEILECPGQAVQVGDGCYEFSREEDHYTNAVDECSRDDHQLFFPETCEEFTHMAHYLETVGQDKVYWVGAEDISGYGEWTWANGNNIPGGAPYWAYDQPQHVLEDAPLKYCGVMDHLVRYYLADDYCNDKHHWICKVLPSTL